MDKSNKMLIDATHPEETRVVVLRNGRVEEFDYESANRKLLRGNIYLAKVTRVEPSLQAAFVDYGGNRHGFLAFSEIHPDYYQIPVADRQALLQEEAQAEAEAEAEADARAEAAARAEDDARDVRDNRQRAIAEVAPADRRLKARASPRSTGDAPDVGFANAEAEDAFDPGVDFPPELTPEPVRQPQHDGVEARERESEDAPQRHEPPFPAHSEHTDQLGFSEAREPEPPAVDLAGEPPGEGLQERPARPAGHRREVERSETQESEILESDILASEVLESEALESETLEVEREASDLGEGSDRADARERESHVEEIGGDSPDVPETVSTVEPADSADAMEEVPERPRRRLRAYKIQEVIKRRQIILVQVVKEERGSKGAALTTYLSLAGRYTVLMPNTGRGGGISRKITNAQDRKRLKAIAHELEVPEGMGLIIRTAGASRTKQEIKRDFEYEIRLWENVRDLTLTSTAPCLVYEEGNLIKRSIRDLYTKDLDEILVAGAAAHAEAYDFMSMLSPGQAKSVVRYDDPEPLFARYLIERQLNAMFSPYVTLKSGGYLVVNQTEALVSIDVNSGKATREFSIEETALHTNLEAAEEIARQLKLRDLAGLIVIDFIDMEERRNNRKVESRLKDALRHDRARIQVGRISHFGLLEMSRQRLRTGVLEGSTSQCPHCQGTGIIRSVESVALAVLRALEDQLLRDARTSLTAVTTADVALYILNNKRAFVTNMESRYAVTVTVTASDRMQGANFSIERSTLQAPQQRVAERAVVNMESGFSQADEDEGASRAGVHAEDGEGQAREWVERDRDEEGGRRGRGRRRRRGRREERHEHRADAQHVRTEGPTATAEAEDESLEPVRVAEASLADRPGSGEQPSIDAAAEEQERRGRRRRRGRRGGRRGRERDEAPRAEGAPPHPGDEENSEPHGNGERGQAEHGEVEAAPVVVEPTDADLAPSAVDERQSFAPPTEAGNGAPLRAQAHTADQPPSDEQPYIAPRQEESLSEEPAQPARKGWWQRRFSAE